MKEWASIFGFAVCGIFLFAWVSQCSRMMDDCRAAGGTPVYEYKNMPSCWDGEGRRIFP